MNTSATSPHPPSAVVLLSGGLDSTTTLAIARSKGFEPYALSFRYGQRHGIELDAARRVAEALGVRQHLIADIDLRQFGGSALTSDLPVPKQRSPDEMASGIPITYVPARNTVFLSFALAWAEVLRASDIFIGVNALDFRRSGIHRSPVGPLWAEHRVNSCLPHVAAAHFEAACRIAVLPESHRSRRRDGCAARCLGGVYGTPRLHGSEPAASHSDRREPHALDPRTSGGASASRPRTSYPKVST